eukprot:1038744-Pleurochrysis_carterae.AAC.2
MPLRSGTTRQGYAGCASPAHPWARPTYNHPWSLLALKSVVLDIRSWFAQELLVARPSCCRKCKHRSDVRKRKKAHNHEALP